MARLTPLLGNWQQAKFSGSTNGVTNAGVSDALTLAAEAAILTGVGYFPRSMRIAAVFDGNITNADISLSIVITDSILNTPTLITASSEAQTQVVRTLPGGGPVCGIFVFDTLNASSIQIALESAITGGGTVKLYYCFQEGPVNA